MEFFNKKISIPTPVFFVLAIFLIAFFFPRETGFKYNYIEGKPWRYGLLTAPFDFPIYKAEQGVNLAKDSVLKSFKPYFILDKTAANKPLANFEKDASAKGVKIEYIHYVKNELSSIYQSGIMKVNDLENLEHATQKKINLREDETKINVSRDISSLYTSKQAYLKLIGDIPKDLDIAIIQSLNVDNYITENVSFDTKTSQKVIEELMREVSSAEGMVQSGQRIIDRGEIVNPRTFDILNSLRKVTGEKSISDVHENWHMLGALLLVTAFMMSFMIYLRFFRPIEYQNRRNVLFMLLMITIFCVLTGLTIDYKLNNYIYAIPFAIATISIRTFIDSRTAMTSHLVMCFICALMVPLPTEFLILQIPVGFMCVFSLKDLSERSQLIRSSFFILVTYVVIYCAYILCLEGGLDQLNWKVFLFFLINFIFVMFSYLLVYMCEKAFGFISGVSLIELSNINKPLLNKLSEEAPGTFQHSMQVANLASAAAIRIGANASLVRTGALYHDIGKTSNPTFFIENKLPGINQHYNLSYKESAQIIIGHVSEGVKIAHKYGLPQQIIDFIVTHHGTGQAKYFYNSYKNENPNEDVDISLFSYPGPNPFSKETAILMMADTVEAASRSLKEYTDESISELVNRLIDSQVSEGLLRNAPITFKDIELVKEIFCEKLRIIYHTRISYPELVKSGVR